MTREFDLNIERVLENWTVAHALREVIANALDEQALTGTAEPQIYADAEGRWHIRDWGHGLREEMGVTPFGSVLQRTHTRAMARIYVNGLRVAEEDNFLFSYNITSPTASAAPGAEPRTQQRRSERRHRPGEGDPAGLRPGRSDRRPSGRPAELRAKHLARRDPAARRRPARLTREIVRMRLTRSHHLREDRADCCRKISRRYSLIDLTLPGHFVPVSGDQCKEGPQSRWSLWTKPSSGRP